MVYHKKEDFCMISSQTETNTCNKRMHIGSIRSTSHKIWKRDHVNNRMHHIVIDILHHPNSSLYKGLLLGLRQFESAEVNAAKTPLLEDNTSLKFPSIYLFTLFAKLWLRFSWSEFQWFCWLPIASFSKLYFSCIVRANLQPTGRRPIPSAKSDRP